MPSACSTVSIGCTLSSARKASWHQLTVGILASITNDTRGWRVLNPLPLKQGRQMPGELLVAVNVSGSYWGGEPKIKQLFEARRKHNRSLPMSILASLIPDGLDVNYFTLTQRMCSLMIQQNAALNVQLYKPDVIVDIPMNHFGSFEYDKVEKISTLGKTRMRKALQEQEESISRDS